ncbi:MAG: hypothetical protein AAF215_30855 [Cyanobacteria bacterium P01_A01_bin.123]
MIRIQRPYFYRTSVLWGLPVLGLSVLLSPTLAWALPPENEVPEEVLRTEIITDARSPLDGQPLTAAEYAALQETLQGPSDSRLAVSDDTRQLIFLLQLRRGARTLIPFIP